MSTPWPSEATIETLANHAIMSALQSAGWRAWVFKPTTHQEKDLGFDGMIETARGFGHRAIYVQYKRLCRVGGPPEDYCIPASGSQHRALIRLQRSLCSAPAVFYAFSKLTGYEMLQEMGGSEEFLKEMVFASASQIRMEGQKTKRYRFISTGKGDTLCEARKSRRSDENAEQVDFWLGNQWIECVLRGSLGCSLSPSNGTVTDEDVRFSHEEYLYGSVDDNKSAKGVSGSFLVFEER